MDQSPEGQPQPAEYDAYAEAPTPPPAAPPPTAPLPSGPGAWEPPPPPSTPRRHRARWVAAGVALGVVVVAGGAGFALGRIDHAGGPSAGGGPRSGFGAPPGSGNQGQQGQNPFGNPFGGDQFGRGPFDSSSQSVTRATADQLVGLVRIATVLGYQGGRAAGTGMILSSTGEVVTNHHVVEGATSIRVTVMSTGTTYQASVVGTDATDDVAVLQLQDASGLSTVATDTSPVSVGDAVTAVGDAGGSTSTFSAAVGKVMATGQHITTRDSDGSTGEALRGLIEISSDVISGDSGGATYDADGEVVGMTTAASTGGRDVVGYAVPISTVQKVADDLEAGVAKSRYDYERPAFLGVGLGGSGTTVAGAYDGTPAAGAGIVAGDRITSVDGTTVRTADALRRAITSHSPGDSVTITWTDGKGTSHSATVTLATGPVE